MRPQTQTILAGREDGHTNSGIPGNCLQAAVASLLELDVDQVPHFALYRDWFAAMRRWARERDGDFTYFSLPPEEYAAAWEMVVAWGREHDSHVLLSGDSPRGPFLHVVVGNVDLEVVHDPHPSRAGLLSVLDAIVYCEPYDPPPMTLELEARRPHPTRQETTMVSKRFQLERDLDVSGISGTGVVAEGVAFTDGTAVIHWTAGEHHSTVVWPSIEGVEAIHGHGGATRIAWLD